MVLKPNSLEMSTVGHELYHILLTKNSSLWYLIHMNNIHSHWYFLRLIAENKYGKSSNKDSLKNDLIDLVYTESKNDYLHKIWNEVQEYTSALLLSYIINKLKDIDQIDICEKIIKDIRLNSPIIKKFLDLSDFIVNYLGVKDGYKFLYRMVSVASSPKTTMEFYSLNQKKINDSKQEKLENDDKSSVGVFQPTNRLIELFNITLNCIEDIKRGIERGALIDHIPIYLAELNGIKFESDLQLKERILTNYEKISKDDRIKKDIYFKHKYEFLKQFGELSNINRPGYWILKDFHSDRLYVINRPNKKDFPDFDIYFFHNILRYQFLKSLEENKCNIKCMDKNLIQTCIKGCNKCIVKNMLNDSKILYDKIKNKYSYEIIKNESIDSDRIQKKLNYSNLILSS